MSICCFCSGQGFFWRLRGVQGPITSYQDIRRQLRRRRCDAECLQDGLKLFILGLCGKVLLADRLALLWQ